jgi:Protein of unknown function (DUF3558)
VNAHRASRSALILAVVTTAVALMSCGREVTGTPTAGSSSASPATSRPPNTGPTSAVRSPPVSDPCSLLNAAELTPLGFSGPGKTDSVKGAPTCVWSKPEGTLGVVSSPRGLGELNLGAATLVTPVTIGSHSGVRVQEVEGAVGDCGITLAVTNTSSMSVDAFIAGKTAEACALAEQAARLVEPKLPRG